MLAEKFKDTQIILASQSPRRQELLKGLDLNFSIETRPVDEVYDTKLKKQDITNYLSQLKAAAFDDLKADDLLITSDTIVWFNDRALEKPSSAAHAREMLTSLSGKTHQVYTSVCFSTRKTQHTLYDCTEVSFAALNPEEIEYYINKYQPFDKAGAYGVQDWLGYVAVEKLNGCYYNVMGLPLPKVYKFLKQC